jgi:hypothetical protein
VCSWQGATFAENCDADDSLLATCWKANCAATCGTCSAKHAKKVATAKAHAVHKTQESAGPLKVPSNGGDETRPIAAEQSSVWDASVDGVGQSCDTSQIADGSRQANGEGECADTAGADGNSESTMGTGLQGFTNGPSGLHLGAYYTITEQLQPGQTTIAAVAVQGRSLASYNSKYYSKILGRFSIYLGSRPFNYDLDGQTLCATNEESTAEPGWSKVFQCDTPTPGPYVTIVQLPDPSLVGFQASTIPKDTRVISGGGTDSDNPTHITAADSPRFLVLAEVAACGA